MPLTGFVMANLGHGFIFEPTIEGHWTLGSGKATERFGGASLIPGGQWLKYRPSNERQSNSHFEPMDCTVAGALNAYETLAKALGFKDFPSNCAERFNAILAGITPTGGSPHASAEAIRKGGVVIEPALPFSEEIYDWDQFYSGMTPELLALGKQITDKFVLGHEWVWNGFSMDKPAALKKALERGPVCVSVFAWKQNDDGLYYKDPGDQDQHWVQIVGYEDGKYWIAFDTYAPFIKHIAWGTDFLSSKVYFLSRRTSDVDILTKIRDLCIQVVGLLKQQLGFKV